MTTRTIYAVGLAALLGLASCSDDTTAETSTTETGTTGDGDSATTTSGDGDPTTTTGDGDGDPTTTTGDGDGDGDPTTTGDGDGDPTTTTSGDGDGDPTGDGDGDPTTTGDGDGDETTTGDGDGDGGDEFPDDTGNLGCDEISVMYDDLVDNASACDNDDQCQVVDGHCWMGLGGCWYVVNDSISQADLDALANQWEGACNGPVCSCIAPPEDIGCIDGSCAEIL